MRSHKSLGYHSVHHDLMKHHFRNRSEIERPIAPQARTWQQPASRRRRAQPAGTVTDTVRISKAACSATEPCAAAQSRLERGLIVLKRCDSALTLSRTTDGFRIRFAKRLFHHPHDLTHQVQFVHRAPRLHRTPAPRRCPAPHAPPERDAPESMSPVSMPYRMTLFRQPPQGPSEIDRVCDPHEHGSNREHGPPAALIRQVQTKGGPRPSAALRRIDQNDG